MNNILEIIMCLFVISCCILSIRSENKRNKQMDEIFKKLKDQWKENE